MPNPSPQSFEAEASVNDAGAQHKAESLEKQLECISLNDSQPSTKLQEPNKIKLSARYLLDKMSRRRLEITRFNFTSGSSGAGRGSHGEVVVATLTLGDSNSLEPGKQVAVKKFVLNEDLDEEKFLRTFANELSILDDLDHFHIVKIIGFVEDIKNRIAWLVFPWEANGNVREFLLSGQWELPERVSLIRDVASGIVYLHSRQPPIRHGDLKSLNILVNGDHRAVITDFGSSRIQTEARRLDTAGMSRSRQVASTHCDASGCDGSPEITLSVTNAELTLTGPSWSFRWAAPEVLNEEEPCLASDIWALGWIAWEIVTDNYPFPDLKTNQAITLKVVRGLTPSLYEDGQLSQIGRLCDVMVKCWKTEPKERPSAAECLETFRWIPSAIPRTRSDGISQVRSAALLVELGDIRRVQSRYGEALKLFGEAITVAQSTGDKNMSARALSLTADCHLRLVNYDKAEECSHQALAIYTSIEDNIGQANIFHGLGDIHFEQRNYAKAEKYYNQVLAMSAGMGSKLVRAHALLGLGRIHRRHCNYADAENVYTQALAIYTGMREGIGQANTLLLLAQIHQEKSDYAKAEGFLKQALAIFTSIGSSFGQASAWSQLGLMHQAQSDYSAAEESLNHALAIFTTIGESLGRAQSLLQLGEVLLRQSRYSEAKSFLDDALQTLIQVGHKRLQNHAKEHLAAIVDAQKLSTEPPPS